MSFSIELIKSEKQRIKSLLDSQETLELRMAMALQQVATLKSVPDPKAQLECYVYCVSALVQAGKSSAAGMISTSQARGLYQIAEAILKINKVNPQKSKMAFLHRELHQAFSQLLRANGDHFLSAWQYLLADKVQPLVRSKRETARSHLALAIRYFRLGHGEKALEEFEKTDIAQLPANLKVTKNLTHGILLRYRAQIPASSELFAQSHELPLDESERLNLLWQQKVNQAATEKNPTVLMQAVAPKSSHRYASYFLDTYFWNLFWGDAKQRQEFPKVQTMGKPYHLHATKEGHYFKMARCIEDCQQASIQLTARLNKLSTFLNERDKILTAERELFILVAAALFLKSIRHHDFAQLVLQEYQKLSQSISSGVTADSLCALP